MDQIVEYRKNYQEYKQELDTELRKTTEGFVRIGYLLKVAKDTDILYESGYANVYDFAQAEYNIDKSQVSRFIHINDRFSENGYSDRLKEQFQGFGHAKLTIMLQLPDEINEELTPDFSKSEIQAIKEEYDAENEITDLEVMMEEEEPGQKNMDSNLYKVLDKLGKEQPELYVQLYDAVYDGEAAVQETFAPDGEKIYSIRIMGVGRMLLSVKGLDKPVTLTNMRSNEKEEYDWEDIMEVLYMWGRPGEGPEECWERTYGEQFPKKEEVAPVQQKPVLKKESKVVKAKTEQKKEQKKEPEQVVEQATLHDISKEIPKPQDTEEISLQTSGNCSDTEETIEETDEQVEGQTDIETDFPEYMPETEAKLVDKSELEKCWEDAELMTDRVYTFFDENEAKSICTLPLEDLKEAYQNAIKLAADLEQIINGKKYLTE